MISARSIALQGLVAAGALAIAVQGLTPASVTPPEPPEPPATPSATLSPGTELAVGLRHQARLALRQAPARVAGRGRVVPREQTEEGALELLLLLDDD